MMNLRTKLVLSHVGLVALAMAVAGLYVLQHMEQFYLDSLLSSLEDQASVTASYLRTELASGRQDLLQLALRDLDRRSATRVQVIDASGRLVGSSENEDDPLLGTEVHDSGVEAALSGQRATSVSNALTGTGNLAAVTAPIMVEGHAIGAVQLAYRLTDVQQEVSQLRRDLGLGLLIGGLGCAIFATLLAGSLAAPIQQLAEAANALARGDLARRVDLRGSDEVSLAGAAFDSLAVSLEQLELSRREVMSEVSHDLHGLATGLSTAAEALQRGALDDPELATVLLQGIAARTRQISRLADDLLQTSRFETGRLVLERRPTDPAAIVEQTAAEFAHQAADQQVALQVNADDQAMQVPVDGERLVQALANLVENALRHTPPGGTITLSARTEQTTLILSVADNGPGLTRDEASRMFGRFYRPSGGRPGRLGLGLGIVRGIAEAHGGRVEVESGVGRGSTFTIRIPIRPEVVVLDAPASSVVH